jgi:hypothetical protein
MERSEIWDQYARRPKLILGSIARSNRIFATARYTRGARCALARRLRRRSGRATLLGTLGLRRPRGQRQAQGARDTSYDEAKVSALMKEQKITLKVALGLGKGRDRVLTCDLTKEYVAINGDYRS